MNSSTYDIIIAGGGPAGLTAGLYASRARLKTLLLEKSRIDLACSEQEQKWLEASEQLEAALE